MSEKLLYAAAIASMMAVAPSMSSATGFPVPTGSCSGIVCHFNNDLLKTRTIGIGASPTSLHIETTNANNRHPQLDKFLNNRVRPVGDGFLLTYSAKTVSKIYAGNDTIITDQHRYDAAARRFEHALARGDQAAARAAEHAARKATATGGHIVAVIGRDQPFQLFPKTKQEIPGTAPHTQFVGSNPANVFSSLVHSSLMTRGKPFQARRYDALTRRYHKLSRRIHQVERNIENTLARREELIADGKFLPPWIHRHLNKLQRKSDGLQRHRLHTTHSAIALVSGGASTQTVEHTLERLLGKTFDTSMLSTIVGLDLFAGPSRGFSQFFPSDEINETQNSNAFLYISIMKDHKGKNFIGFGVVSQHNEFRRHI